MLRVGIDTGGTFTDFVRLDERGIAVHKIRTSGAGDLQAIAEGLRLLVPDRADAAVVYGTTVATNAVLERKGAHVALVTTEGFEDVLAIGRQTRPELYNLQVAPRRPLVDPALTFGVAGRLGPDGSELRPLDSGEIASLAAALAASGAEAAAVCLLHAYANSRHEAEVAARLRASGLLVSASHEILPEYREYERCSTTVVNAYVQPIMERHLDRLEQVLGGRTLTIMQSSGGSIPAPVARAQAVRTVLSGPAAGVVGAQAAAAAAGLSRIISFDAGGTSTDVSLCDGEIPFAPEAAVGDVPVRLPVIDIHTVGAGGGSIARVDRGGALAVGPASAGAAPGPACYGLGSDLTVTDAHLLLGRIDPEYFLGGRMMLYPDRARRAAADLARSLGLSIEDLAEGVIRVANASMLRAIRVVSLERGHDPRLFALVAFGGAGAMHGADLAAGLDIRTVLVPRQAGVLSALGMLAADQLHTYSAAVLRPARALTMAELDRQVAPLVARARRDLSAEGFATARQSLTRLLDVRYIGQSYELSVPWSAGYVQSFHALHQKRYGYADPARPVEVVALRVRAVGLTEAPHLPYERPVRPRSPRAAAIRRSRFDGRLRRTAFYRWDQLTPGDRAPGPAVIAGAESTVVVPPGFVFSVDGYRNVVLRRGGGR